jgi:hypothetical protein
MAAPRSVTIQLQDSSQAQIFLQSFSLAGGSWQTPPGTPVPGTVISPTSTPSYVNAAGTVYDTIGGTISLAPASGGQITITWSWSFGSSATASVTSQSLTGIAVSYSLAGTQTTNPTLSVITQNAASLEAMFKGGAKATAHAR